MNMDKTPEQAVGDGVNESPLKWVMEANAWRTAMVGLCIGSDKDFQTPDAAAHHLRARLTPRPAVATPADIDHAPRYKEWMHLRTNGVWSDGIPDWARDQDGRMNDMTAARAVIEELALLRNAALAAQPQARKDGDK